MTNEELLEKVRELADKANEKAGCCPSCGRCNECGRGPWQTVPYYPYYPYPTYPWWGTYTITCGGANTSSFNVSGNMTTTQLPPGSAVTFT